MYANADGLGGRVRTDQTGVLDRYVLAKTRRLVEDVTAAMDTYDLAGATGHISLFLDALTNWYVRRSRDRFWRPVDAGTTPLTQESPGAPPDDKQDAYDTLHTVLEVLCRVSAPFLPFLSEAVYRGLTGERSVHLNTWPLADELPSDPGLVEAMDLAREVCSAGHSIRKAAGRRARLPLSSLTVAAPGAGRLLAYADLIADEVNVQQVKLVETVGDLAETVLNVIPAVLGPRLGERTQHVIAATRRGDWSRLADGSVEAGGVRLENGEFELRLRPSQPGSSRTLPGEVGIVALDLETTPELEAEGLARDVIRFVQRARRERRTESHRPDQTVDRAPERLSRRRRTVEGSHRGPGARDRDRDRRPWPTPEHRPRRPMTSSQPWASCRTATTSSPESNASAERDAPPA